MCHLWWEVAAGLLPWALSSCERAQLLLLGLAEPLHSFLLPHLPLQVFLGPDHGGAMVWSNIKEKKKQHCGLIQVVHSTYDQNPYEAADTTFAS